MGDMGKLFTQGGAVMVALVLLSLLLYERCFDLYLRMRQSSRELNSGESGVDRDPDILRYHQELLNSYFERNMIRIRTLVAAAPLLGLLGTVIGMVETFTSLADQSGERTIQGLSDGISKALITTETGLAIAIPAMIIVYFAQRKLSESIRSLIQMEEGTSGGSAA